MLPLLHHPEPRHEDRGRHEQDQEDPDGQLAPGGWLGGITHFIMMKDLMRLGNPTGFFT
jgi:hypothetical protein